MAKMIVTQWFDSEKPSHIGVYERQGFAESNPRTFTYWNGEYFGYLGETPLEALNRWHESGGKKSFHQNRPWRGTVKPKRQK